VAEGGELRLRPDAGEVYVALDRYPGELLLRPARKSGMNVINVVDLELYLRGVVPSEIGHTDRYTHAAMAQAVAARTYALRHLHQHDNEGYDLQAGVMDQVYGPLDKHHPEADVAVEATRGMILAKDGQPIRASYASTCGGRTANAEESFSFREPYLESHADDLGGQVCCRTSKYYRWEASWSGDELYRILSRNIPVVTGKVWRGTRVQEIEVAEKGKSGRAVTLRVQTDAARYEVSRLAIRQVLERPEGGMLRSTDFELKADRRDGRVTGLVAKGRGWGHGVGMCQWGAMQLSTEGYDFQQILAHYYPGTELRRLY
jgi:stage II sporulation protein D